MELKGAKCTIRKYALPELAFDVCGKGQAHFLREIVKADVLFVVVENRAGIEKMEDLVTWENPRIARYEKICRMHEKGKWQKVPLPKTPPVTGKMLAEALRKVQENYANVTFCFCSPAEAGKCVSQILEKNYEMDFEGEIGYGKKTNV